MLFIAHLCNHILLQSGGGTWGTALHTIEGWVLGVGMSTLGRKRLCTPSIGDPIVPMTLEHPRCGFAASVLILRQRIQIGMFRPIRLDHTNCLQVAIKTQSSVTELQQSKSSTCQILNRFFRQCPRRFVLYIYIYIYIYIFYGDTIIYIYIALFVYYICV
jgi:hypothetical protein